LHEIEAEFPDGGELLSVGCCGVDGGAEIGEVYAFVVVFVVEFEDFEFAVALNDGFPN
jgi:hypothetical protein